jgi:hypothetical protein
LQTVADNSNSFLPKCHWVRRYPNLQPGVDIQVDANGFVVAEPASSRQFLAKHYLNPIPLQQIQLSKGTLAQNAGW